MFATQQKLASIHFSPAENEIRSWTARVFLGHAVGSRPKHFESLYWLMIQLLRQGVLVLDLINRLWQLRSCGCRWRLNERS